MSAVPLTRGWWRSQSPARRYGLALALPYLIGAVIAYLFVVLGSSWPRREKERYLAIALAAPVLVAIAWGALSRWPRRVRLVCWLVGLAFLVPFGWWSGHTTEDRVAAALGVATAWTVAVPWLVRRAGLGSQRARSRSSEG